MYTAPVSGGYRAFREKSTNFACQEYARGKVRSVREATRGRFRPVNALGALTPSVAPSKSLPTHPVADAVSLPLGSPPT